MVASSGTPFNITTTNDLNNDSIFNDRPGLCINCDVPSIGHARLRLQPHTARRWEHSTRRRQPGERIVPINYATGPTHVVLNLRLTKTFGFGPKVAGNAGNQGRGWWTVADTAAVARPWSAVRRRAEWDAQQRLRSPLQSDFRRFNARNVFNKVNFANPSGILGSRFFDTSNRLQGGPFSNWRGRIAASI